MTACGAVGRSVVYVFKGALHLTVQHQATQPRNRVHRRSCRGGLLRCVEQLLQAAVCLEDTTVPPLQSFRDLKDTLPEWLLQAALVPAGDRACFSARSMLLDILEPVPSTGRNHLLLLAPSTVAAKALQNQPPSPLQAQRAA